MIELQQLRTFCAVVEKKSFTIAGELVGRTQSTISGQISSLEKLYDTALLDRSGREIMVTESGRILYDHAKRILELMDKSREEINGLRKVVKGDLIIGASTIPGTYILPGIIGDFKKRYPEVSVSLRISNSKNVINGILDHTLAVGAVGEKKEDERVEYLELARDRIVLVVPLSHKLASASSVDLNDLKNEKFISREIGSATRATVEAALKRQGITQLDFTVELGSTEAVKEGVKAGLGISFVSERAVKDDSLVRVEVRKLDIHRHFYVIRLSKGPSSRAAQALVDFVETERYHD
jgi:DNA-binding transcriptional LysR family regulator